MKNKFVSTLVFSLALASCSVENSPNSKSHEMTNAIMGGRTHEKSLAAGAKESDRFAAISQHVVLVGLEVASADGKKQLTYTASGVILADTFIITSAHLFEDFKFDANHSGVILFGASEPVEKRIRQEFSKEDFLNRNPHQVDELSKAGWSSLAGNKDYVLIRLRNGLPEGYSPMTMVNDPEIFQNGESYRVAGFGLSENNAQDLLLRTLDVKLSRSDVNQKSKKFPTPSKKTGIEDRKYFLEFFGSETSTVQHGDSGGPYYFEALNKSGKLDTFLIGIVNAHDAFNCDKDSKNCDYADYGLRVDAFYKDVMDTASRLANGNR